MRADIEIGTVFPDYELADHTGERRKLSDVQGPDPMILVLSRGGFCPRDIRQAEGLVELYREMEVGYSRLVTISTDNMLATNGLAVFHHTSLRAFSGGQRPPLEAGTRKKQSLRFTLMQ
jgi:peroxiredoxin